MKTMKLLSLLMAVVMVCCVMVGCGSGNEATETTTTQIATNDDLVNGAVKIKNQKGAELPSTGGIGTTMFYVVGSVLVIGAAVVLISKRRMAR
jgi:LPXTG-motif cell wall-anchored protein